MYIKIFAFFVSCSFLSSCDSLVTDVDPKKLPAFRAKMVVNCNISPNDSLMVASVQNSKSVFETITRDSLSNNNSDIKVVTNAKISISNGTTKVSLNYDPREMVYWASTKNFKIEAGKTYTLSVIDSLGVEHIATTTVPKPVDFDISFVKLDSSMQAQNLNPGQYANEKYDFGLSWKAPSKTYYQYSVFETTKTSIETPGGKINVFNQFNMLRYQFQTNEEAVPKVITSKWTYWLNYEVGKKPDKKYAMRLYSSDIHTYKYFTSLQGNRQDNPFVEPTLVYSNFKDLFGCFGSYSYIEKPFVLTK